MERLSRLAKCICTQGPYNRQYMCTECTPHCPSPRTYPLDYHCTMSINPPQKKTFLSSHPLLEDPFNRRLLYEASEKAEGLRRKLLRGANVLIVGGGNQQDAFLWDFMKSAGMHVYVMDCPETIWSEHASSGHISGFIPCNISDIEGIEQRALEALQSSNFDKNIFDAVTSHHDEALVASALVAKALNLHTNNPDAFLNADSKLRMRQTLERANLPVPKYRKVSQVSEVADVCDYIGFPVIVKPTSAHHSIGVQRADNIEDAVNAFIECCRTLTKERNEEGATIDEDIMMEEYLDGDEFDVDVILSEGKCVYAKVTDNWHQPPFFQDYGTHTPSILEKKKQRELERFAVDSLLGLGFENGVSHVEFRYKKEGPHLIEVNPRLGCGPVLKDHEVAWGINLLEQHCFTTLRIPSRPVVPERCLSFSVGLLINAPFSGTVNQGGWLDFLHDEVMLAELKYHSTKGDVVVGPEENVPTIIAVVVLFSKESREEVNARALQLLETTPVPIEEGPTGKRCGFYVPKDVFPFV